MSFKNHNYQVLPAFTGLLVIVSGVMLYFNPPGAYPDQGWGFQVMRGMEQGLGFNILASPDPADISKNHAAFLSWWSPGQYLVPYLFKILFRVNTGQATALTVGICSIIGLWGYYLLFIRLGFTKWISALSITFMVCQQFFILPYIFYTGGEVLLFAFMGWFLYGCFGFVKISLPMVLFVFAAGLLGFFSKSSGLWLYIAGIICLWVNISAGEKNIWKWIRNGIISGIPVICSLAVIYFFYLSRGETPLNTSAVLSVSPETFSFPIAAPLLAGFSIDELFNGLLYHPDGALVSYNLAIAILVLLALASLAFVIAVTKLIPGPKYILALITFYIIGGLFFSYLYITHAAISFEGRHFRIIGLLAIPGILWLMLKTKPGRWALVVVWAFYICNSFIYYKKGYNANIHAAHSRSGLAQPGYAQPVVNALTKLDSAHPHDAVFVFAEPAIAAEIANNRTIILDIEDMDKEDFAEMKYAGQAGFVYVLMPIEYEADGHAAGIIRSFTGYQAFDKIQLDKEFYLYSASQFKN